MVSLDINTSWQGVLYFAAPCNVYNCTYRA